MFGRITGLGAIIAADLIGAVVLAESAALMGTRTLRGDADLQYHWIAVLLRQGRWKEASEVLDEFRASWPQDARGVFLAAFSATGSQDYARAKGLAMSASTLEGLPRQLRFSAASLSAQLLLRRILLWTSLLMVFLGLAGFVWFSSWCLGVSLAGALIGLAAVRACRRLFMSSLRLPGARGLRLTDISCLSRTFPKGTPEN